MKKVLLFAAAVTTLGATAAAAPAGAQPWRGDYGYEHDHGYRAPYRLTTPYVDSLDWKLAHAAEEGRISWREANALRWQVKAVHDISWRVQTGGARPWEVERLDRVVTRVEQAVDDRGPSRW